MLNVESFIRQHLAEFEGSDQACVPQNREKLVNQLVAWIDPERLARFAAHDGEEPEPVVEAATNCKKPPAKSPRAA